MDRLIKYCSIGLLFLISSSAFPQKHIVLNLPTLDNRAEFSQITNISSIEVASALPDSTYIGIVPSEIPNTRNILEAPTEIQIWLQSFIDKAHGSSFNSSGSKLLWSIDALSIGVDSSDTEEFSYVKLGAEILIKNEKEDYQQLGRFDTIIISKPADITLSKQLVTALGSLFSNSVLLTTTSDTRKIKNVPASLEIAKEKVLINYRKANERGILKWKILSDSIYPKGVFMAFKEFKDNAPSVTSFITKVDTATEKIYIYQFMADSSFKPLNDVWGISVNNELYRYKDGNLFPIEKEGKGFALSKYLDFRKRKNQGFYWRKNIGSLLKDNNPFDDKHIYRVSLTKDLSSKVESTRLDDNGDLTF